MGLFNNGTSRYIKNRAPVLRIQKDLFFFLFFFSRNEVFFFFNLSLFIEQKEEKKTLTKQMHHRSGRQMPDSEKRFPMSVPSSEGPGGRAGLGVTGFNRG